jgi:hypothetical protein
MHLPQDNEMEPVINIQASRLGGPGLNHCLLPVVFLNPSRKMPDIASKQATTASFHTLSNSLSTKHSVISNLETFPTTLNKAREKDRDR